MITKIAKSKKYKKMSDETMLDKSGIGHKVGFLAYWLIDLLWTLHPLFYCINTQIPKKQNYKKREKLPSFHLFRKLFIMNMEFKFPIQ